MARIFAGIEVTSRLKDQLDEVSRSEEVYFRFNDPRYLMLVENNDRQFLGRWLEDPVSLELVDNIHENIASIIKLILPHNRLTRDHFKFFLLEEETETQ
ncbi:MAG: hypothetical protein ISR91_03190 [Candidatus Delongbacteria bacterium]|nr:hypothetical protein [Candidatus Delongbacteria bacterium]